MPHPENQYKEKELLLLIAEGNEAAFKELYVIYAPLLASFTGKLTRSASEADEIIQETFIRLWISRDKLPHIQYHRTWIYEVASHVVFNWFRKKLREKNALSRYQERQKRYDNSLEEHIGAKDTREIIYRAIQQLPAQRKRIFILSREKGMNIPEIADSLNISPNTVKNSLVKALADIRLQLSMAGYNLCLLWVLFFL